MNTKIALLLFKTMILSYYDIGDIFYNSCTKSDLKKLQTLQNRALKIVYLKNSDHTIDSLHQKADLHTLQSRRNLNLVALVHSKKIPALSQMKVSQRPTRSASRMLLAVPFSHNNKYCNSFVYKAIQLWNNLPEKLKLLPHTTYFFSPSTFPFISECEVTVLWLTGRFSSELPKFCCILLYAAMYGYDIMV